MYPYKNTFSIILCLSIAILIFSCQIQHPNSIAKNTLNASDSLAFENITYLDSLDKSIAKTTSYLSQQVKKETDVNSYMLLSILNKNFKLKMDLSLPDSLLEKYDLKNQRFKLYGQYFHKQKSIPIPKSEIALLEQKINSKVNVSLDDLFNWAMFSKKIGYMPKYYTQVLDSFINSIDTLRNDWSISQNATQLILIYQYLYDNKKIDKTYLFSIQKDLNNIGRTAMKPLKNDIENPTEYFLRYNMENAVITTALMLHHFEMNDLNKVFLKNFFFYQNPEGYWRNTPEFTTIVKQSSSVYFLWMMLEIKAHTANKD